MKKTIKLGLLFPPANTDKPILTHLVQMGLSVNLLKASISQGKKGKVVLELTGSEQNVEKGVEYLSKEDIAIKIYTDSIIRFEEKCMHCGACTAVCPSGALVMNKDTWELEFDMEKCLLCGHCVSACPARAIKSFEDITR